jgi:RecB family exonuclease
VLPACKTLCIFIIFFLIGFFMQVIFGLEYDTGSYPDELAGSKARLGIVHLGPFGLMDLLETRLGAGAKPASRTLRIGQYLRRMQTLSGNHFFSESLRADPWATAKHLLDWRDALVLGGWDGTADDKAPGRIQSLALLEQQSDAELAAGFGERVSRIQGLLEKGANPGISRIVCAEPFKFLPAYWKKIFNLMEKSGCQIQPAEPVKPSGASTDLEILKQKLSGSNTDHLIAGDESIVLLSCANEFAGAELLAGWLSAKKDFSDILWITNGGSHILDHCLSAHGMPRISTDHRSRWRTILQVLPLALAVRWAPFDPQLFLEWLSLPQLPFPPSLAAGFRNALLQHPGRGGVLWEAARKKCLSDRMNQLKEKDLSSLAIDQETANLEQILDFWFDMESHDPEIGMPAEIISEVCRKIASWAIARGKKTDDPLFISAAALATEVSETITAGGQDRIAKPELDRILDYVYADGYKNIDDIPQAASWAAVSSPGQVRSYADTIIWWNFVDTQRPDAQLPWRQSERQWLEASQITFEEPMVNRLRQALSWRHAALCCCKQLILVYPRQLHAEPVNPHPFWDEIYHLLNLDDNPQAGIIRRTDGFYNQQDSPIFGLHVPKQKVAQCQPPGFEPIWNIAPNTIMPRNKESFSSMDKLIRCPRAWVLQYILKLDPGISLSVLDGNQSAGTLAHKIVEMVFKQNSKPSPEEACKRALVLFDEMVPQMAATLLQPEREIERSRYRADMARAIFHLTELINASGLEYKASEMQVEKPFIKNASAFTGIIDLLLTRKDGSIVFWDLKWSKRAKYRREELENREALQLAAYSWLLARDEASYPPGGYYMLGQAELLSGPCDCLPSECIAGNLDLRAVWKAAKRTFLKQMKELDQGIVAAGCSKDESSENQHHDEFELEARCDWCEFVHLCGENI